MEGCLVCREVSQNGLGFPPMYFYCYFPAVNSLCSFIGSLFIFPTTTFPPFPRPLKYRPESCLTIEEEIQNASISHTHERQRKS